MVTAMRDVDMESLCQLYIGENNKEKLYGENHIIPLFSDTSPYIMDSYNGL